MNDRKLKDAEQFAEKIVKDENLTLPINVLALASSRDIHVEAKPVNTKGVSGMLIRSGENYAIAYATHIMSSGFQRFSIAHELGHYFLAGHPEAVFRSGQIHESRSGFTSGDQIELEADHFAAGLLMPKHLFKSAAGRYSDGFEAIKHLADDFGTSLTASAIRYARLTDAAVAIIVSSGSSIEYCFVSEAMRRPRGFQYPKKGAVLPQGSTTREFNRDLQAVASAMEKADDTDLCAWFHTDDEVDASEEVIGLGDYGKTLTVITANIPDENENDDAEWAPPQFKY